MRPIASVPASVSTSRFAPLFAAALAPALASALVASLALADRPAPPSAGPGTGPVAGPAVKARRQLAATQVTDATDLMFLVNPEAPFEVRMATEDRRAGYVEGERFRVVVTATADCWITILNWGPEGNVVQVAPAKPTTGSTEPLRLARGERLVVPAGGAAFKAQPPHGESNLRVFATAQPLTLPFPRLGEAPPPKEGGDGKAGAGQAEERNPRLRELLGSGRGSKDIAVDEEPASPLEGKEWDVADVWVTTGTDRADLATRMGVSEEEAVAPVQDEAPPDAAADAGERALRERPARRNPNPPIIANIGSAASDEYLARWQRVLSGQAATKSLGTRFVPAPALGGRQMPRLDAGAVPGSADLLVVRALPPGGKGLGGGLGGAVGGAAYTTQRVPLVPPGSKSVGTADELLARRAAELRAADPTVRAVIPDRTWQIFAAQSEEPADANIFRGLQWHLHNQEKSGNDIGWVVSAVELIDIQPALMGVVDQGIHVNDPRLRAAIAVNPGETPGNGIDDDGNGHVDDVDGWNFASDSPSLASGDGDFNHGSYCTSIMAGGVPRSPGYFFPVAYDAKVVVAACMAWEKEAGTARGSLLATLQAIEYAMQRGARVINLSLGGPTTWQEIAELGRHPLFDELERRGVLLVIAAGNERIDIDNQPVSPACMDRPNTIVVMAVDPDGQPARARNASTDAWEQYSNWGRNHVHIAAPGTMILGIPSVDSTSYGDGTSYAAPIVTAAAAILMGKHPEWDVATVKRAILETARPVAGLEERCLSGGELDLRAALQWTP